MPQTNVLTAPSAAVTWNSCPHWFASHYVLEIQNFYNLSTLPLHFIFTLWHHFSCTHLCAGVCGVILCIHTCLYLFLVQDMYLPCWLCAGCLWPPTKVPLYAKARIRDGGKTYHGPMVYFGWQSRSSFTQTLFAKDFYPYLWEFCLRHKQKSWYTGSTIN